MKTDLATNVITAIIGVVASYFVCNILLSTSFLAIQDVSINELGSTINYTLVQPNPEVFNYRAINPTVEVYVGQGYQNTSYSQNSTSSGSLQYDDELIIIDEGIQDGATD